MKTLSYLLISAILVFGGFFFLTSHEKPQTDTTSAIVATSTLATSSIPVRTPQVAAGGSSYEGATVTPAQKPVDTPAQKSAEKPLQKSTLIKDLPERQGDAKALYPVAPSAGSEWTPDLYAEATKEVVADTRWSLVADSIGPQDIIRVPLGVTLTYDGSSPKQINAIVVRGSLVFDPTVSTKLTIGTIFILGEGKVAIKPSAGKTAEIVFKGSLERKQDPAELLLGLIAVGGTVDIAGADVATPFVKVVGSKGGSSLVVSAPVDWKIGDEVFLSASGPSDADPTYWWFNARDTSRRMPFPEEWESAHVQSISGSTITLDKALSYSHSGYVANLSRSVVLRSNASTPLKSRGHVMFSGSTSVSVKNARFKDLGRTTVSLIDNTNFNGADAIAHYGANEEGRYALHVHHLSLPFTISGNVIDGTAFTRSYPGGSGERAIYGSPKWGIVDHDSSGTISRNVVIGAAGAGIVGEDGTETGVIENNLVIGTGGGSGDNDDERFGVTKGEDMGHGGFGYWFRGPFLNVRNNVALGHFNQNAYLYFVHPEFVRNSLSRDPWIPADLRGKAETDLVSLESVREFRGNYASGFFGNAAFAAFYSQAPIVIDSSRFEALGAGSTGGILLRHSKSLLVKNSSLTGNGDGSALVSSPEAGQISQSETVISGFAK